MDKKKTEYFRQVLLAKRRDLAGEVDNLRHEGLAPVEDGPMDSGDDAANTYAKTVSLGISETEREMIRQIDEALDRIEAGEYGICVDCNEKIAEARLKAVPYADLCINCKSDRERGVH